MTHGKKVCKILKEIRQQIADKNEIEYITSECHYHGECKGTCPKCEAELKYLENELQKRKQLGKVATIAGISLGIAGAFTACNTSQKLNSLTHESKVVSKEMPAIYVSEVPGSEQELVGVVALGHWEYKNNDILMFTDSMPKFPGGGEALKNFIQKNLHYPEEAKEKKIEGTVMLDFVVEKDGSLTNVKILVKVHPILDAEAINVIKSMPNWIPGQFEGKNARIRYTLPVTFLLKDAE